MHSRPMQGTAREPGSAVFYSPLSAHGAWSAFREGPKAEERGPDQRLVATTRATLRHQR
jgi:hypothetical protein